MEKNLLYNDISNVIAYIEANLKSEITLDKISEHVNISKFHLNRVFHAISSNTLMNYVRGRKLSSSIDELLNTNLKVSDISQEYSFNYEQSYIRSFINTFGISPDKFRKEKPPLKIKDKIDLGYIRAIGENGAVIKPQITIIPEFLLTGIRYKIFNPDDRVYHESNARGNDFFSNHRHKIKNAVSYEIYFSLIQYIADNTYSYYMPSLQVQDEDATPEGMICQRVLTNKYAIFKYIGLHHASGTNINNLMETLKYIYGEWFPKSNYYQCTPYHLERIDSAVSREDYCEVEICIPVTSADS